VYPCRDDDSWVAIACRHDDDWAALVDVVAEPWAKDGALAAVAGRLAARDRIDAELVRWTSTRGRDEVAAAVRAAGVPAAPVLRPPERCDTDPDNQAWGLWPTVTHAKHGPQRVDGLPVHLSATAGPVLGEDNERVLSEVLGLTTHEIGRLAEEGVI
jgi:crotonobetainyl-CoA:carnitine CoA-transferase CaiB-like acyl-CoA transferase